MPPLIRTLRLRDLFLLFVGSVIGSGIFRTPGPILRQVGGSVGLSMLVWIVGGVLSLLGALTYAELAARSPEAGGLYCYIRDAFGRAPAFLYGWCLFLVIASGSVAALARVFSEYLAKVLPISPATQTLVAVLVIAVVTAVNVWGTRKSSDLQNWTTLIKVGIIVILSAVLLSLGRHAGEILPAMGPTQQGLGLFSMFGLAMINVLWAYEGWQFGTYSAGEVIDPQKAFPRAFLLGSLVLMGLYLIAVVAYLFALGPAATGASETIAATAVGAVLGPWAGKIIALTILISTFSAANSVILTAPRVFYAMANDGLFFKKLADVSARFKTPAAAIVGLGVWSAVLVCAGELGSFKKLIEGVIFIGWIFYGLGAAAIFPIRRASKGLPIPYRVPGYPWTPLVFVVAAAAIVGNAVVQALLDPSQFNNLVIAIALFLLGLPAYFFWRKRAAS
ncbi:MAG TPA: amino acid permease [Candidatus Acidoferrum sp.]|jgi:APA family basic amino acid/polyamine antiporter|nr:amino acid permease [Candidatus Acidoferrum sp.]